MVDDPLDEPFTRSEFDSALGACRARSAPGLDGMSYEILRKFSDGMYSFMLCLFNCMFRDSSFSSSWRDTYVIFLPKPGGRGHRPISLTSSISKLFERMVHRRFEHRAEHRNWVPNFQFGFRRGRSALDAVAVVTTDISQAFGRGESVAAVSVDIKGAFNSVLSPILYNIYTIRLIEVLPPGVRYTMFCRASERASTWEWYLIAVLPGPHIFV